MAPFSVVIRGGTVVTPAGSRTADIGIRGETIVAVEPGLPVASADRVVDAAGLLVLPGVIDVHTHTRIASDEEPDRFFRDSVAAAFGGTTTFLAFDNPGTGISASAERSLVAAMREWSAATEGESAVDYGLSGVVTSQQDDPLREIQALVDAGVPTMKAFMVYEFGIDEQALPGLMRAVGAAGGMLQLHCEDATELRRRTAALVASGAIAPSDHAVSRPPAVEAGATARAVAWALAQDAPLYVVHLSCTDALAAVRSGKADGAAVFAETCPHFLALDESRYLLPEQESIRYVVSPPLRSPADRDALWAGLSDAALDVVATDHVPDRLAVEKRYRGQPFTEISNGAPGIETLLSVVYSAGVVEGRMTLERMVDVLSATPARLFGLERKGALESGRDADVVLFDPAHRGTIQAAGLHHTSDYTPFEGMAVAGAVRAVFLRGHEVIRDGAFVGRRGYGRFQGRRLAWR
jgi:dihydropyrimidinase